MKACLLVFGVLTRLALAIPYPTHEPVTVDPGWYNPPEGEDETNNTHPGVTNPSLPADDTSALPVELMRETRKNPKGKPSPAGDDLEVEEEDEMTKLKGTIGGLARQLMLTQLYVEELTRGDGHSGLKRVRLVNEGSRPYHASSHMSSKGIAAIHDHSNNIRVVGLGEFTAVLNGVEFRTRHNDYHLVMPSHEKKVYHKTEEIPYPDVPPEVLSQGTYKAQIEEMQQWFKAWRDQDHSVRDYRKYFKPVLCYLEGAYTSTSSSIDESFESDRHHLDAATWFEMQEKIKFTSYTGRKSQQENYAYLPTMIMDVINDTYPIYAQWNYRILCHPVEGDIPLNRFRVVDDLGMRMGTKKTYDEHEFTRAARFQLNWNNNTNWSEKIIKHSFLDKLMEQIPGKDNYKGKLIDDAFGTEACKYDDPDMVPLNAAYYHRWYKVSKAGAMGRTIRHRGFSDENLFVALNERPQIMGTSVTDCVKEGNDEICNIYTQKVSYAIPLEIIYLTPLYNWNPYNIEYKGKFNTPEGETVTADGRNGATSSKKAFNGTCNNKFFRTPKEFFTGDTMEGDPADTSKGVVGVLDSEGKLRQVQASGTYIFLPNITGVGVLRQRYPIMPIHGEGSSVWKEVEALKDIVMETQKYVHMLRMKPTGDGGNSEPVRDMDLEMGYSKNENVDQHSHTVTLDPHMQEELKKGKTIKVETTIDIGHTHDLEIVYKEGDPNPYQYKLCDNEKQCWDGHPKILHET